MAPFGKIYTYPNNYRVQRVQAIAELNGLEIEIVPDFEINVTNRTPEFLAKFPLGRVPAFESADGQFHLTESQAIARYVAESGPKADQLLGGSDAKSRALVEMWSCFAEQELALNTVVPWIMTMKLFPYDEAVYTRHVEGLERALKRVEVALQGGKKFLVGEELTLADIMIFGPLKVAGGFLMDAEMRKVAPSVEGYLKGLFEVPELKKAFGELEFCEKRTKPEA